MVAKELSASDIRSLLAGPAVLDFGRVAAAAEATACFCINNTLSHPVHALVDANSFEHLQRSAHMSQVLLCAVMPTAPITRSGCLFQQPSDIAHGPAAHLPPVSRCQQSAVVIELHSST